MGGLKKGVTMRDMELLQGAAMTFSDLYSPEKISPMFKATADAIIGANRYRSGEGLNLTAEGGKQYTDWARKWAEEFKTKRANNPCHPRSRTRKLLE